MQSIGETWFHNLYSKITEITNNDAFTLISGKHALR